MMETTCSPASPARQTPEREEHYDALDAADRVVAELIEEDGGPPADDDDDADGNG